MIIYLKRIACFVLCVISVLLLTSIPSKAAEPEYSIDFTQSEEGNPLPDGWSVYKGSASIKNGYLELEKDTILCLPENQTNSNFTYEADFTITEANNSSRWFSLMYHLQGSGSDPAPYMNMCIRQDATASNGVEVAYRTSGYDWNVVSTASYDHFIEEGKVYTAQAIVNGNKVMESIDSKPMILYDNVSSGENGKFALQTNGCKARVYGVRLKETQPLPDSIPSEADKIKEVYEPNTGIVAAPTVVSQIDEPVDISKLSGSKPPQVALFDLVLQNNALKIRLNAETPMDLRQGFELCGKKVIPAFLVDNIEEAKALIEYVRFNGEFDLMAVSESNEVLQYIYEEEPSAIRTIRKFQTLEGEEAISSITHTSKASIAMVPKSISRASVEYLQSRFLSVWLMDNQADDEEMTRGAMDNGANGIVVKNAEAVYRLYELVDGKNVYCRKTPFIGHRGYPKAAPENTVESLREAGWAGVEAVECDVYITSDQRLIVNHNGDISGYTTSSARGNVESMTLAQLKSYTLKKTGQYSNCKFATLDELFDTMVNEFPEMILVVEIKTSKPEVAQMIKNLAEQKGVEDRIVVISFNASQISNMGKTMPGIGLGYLSSHSGNSTSEAVYQVMKSVGKLGAAFDPNYGGVNKAQMYALRHRGIATNVWTVDGESNIETQINNAAFSITTDDSNIHKNYNVLFSPERLNADYILGRQDKTFDLSVGDVRVNDGDMVRVYQSKVNEPTPYGITIANGAKATVILDNINQLASVASGIMVGEHATLTLMVKGTNYIEEVNAESSAFELGNGSESIIKNFDSTDGTLILTQGTEKNGKAYQKALVGANASSSAKLDLMSGVLDVKSKDNAPAIGATQNSELVFNVNGGKVSAMTTGMGAAIGTPGLGDAGESSTVTVNLNGGDVKAQTQSENNQFGGEIIRSGAAIGTGYGNPGNQHVVCNIPEGSGAALSITSAYGGAGIGTSGCWINGATADSTANLGKEIVELNVHDGTISGTTSGQAPVIGIGSGNHAEQDTLSKKVLFNMNGGNVSAKNIGTDSKGGASPVGIGMFSKNTLFELNLSGGSIDAVSSDSATVQTESPAIGVSEMNKNNADVKIEPATNNMLKLKISGGSVRAQTQSANPAIQDIGASESNTLDIVIDDGELQVVNEKMSVKAKNSEGDNVYPATFVFSNKTENFPVQEIQIGDKHFKNNLCAVDGKVSLWTKEMPDGQLVTAILNGETQNYVNHNAKLTYSQGFTFDIPDVALKQEREAQQLGNLALIAFSENQVTLMLDGTDHGANIFLAAFEHGTSNQIGESQAVVSGQNEYVFQGMTSEKIYDFKTFIDESEEFWGIESDPVTVMPFSYAPTLLDATIGQEYRGDVSMENDLFRYELSEETPLPEGMQFNENGEITGIPVKAGTTEMKITAIPKEPGIASSNRRTAQIQLTVKNVLDRIEYVGEGKNYEVYANSVANKSADSLRAYINMNTMIKGIYIDHTVEVGSAEELGLQWTTESSYQPKGGEYVYQLKFKENVFEQSIKVSPVEIHLRPLQDIIKTVYEGGYESYAAIGLPENVQMLYPEGVNIVGNEKSAGIQWITEVPKDFGKTVLEKPFVFEGSVEVPSWASVREEDKTIRISVELTNKTLLKPVISIKDKVYDGSVSAELEAYPFINREDLAAGTDVQLSGIADMEFIDPDAGADKIVRVNGLTLTGTDAVNYELDLSGIIATIFPKAIQIDGVVFEDKTVFEDGTPQAMSVKGTLPEGIGVEYRYLKKGESTPQFVPPKSRGDYLVTAQFLTDANHIAEPESLTANLIINASEMIRIPEIETGLSPEAAEGMVLSVLCNGTPIQAGASAQKGDVLTYCFGIADKREVYVPYELLINGKLVHLEQIKDQKGYSGSYTIGADDNALTAKAKCGKLGDFTEDKKINIIDAQRIAQMTASGETPSNAEKVLGDVNFDQKLNIIDAQKIAQYSADIKMHF